MDFVPTPLSNQHLFELVDGLPYKEIGPGIFQIPLHTTGGFAHLTDTTFIVGVNACYPDLRGVYCLYVGFAPGWVEDFDGNMLNMNRDELYARVNETLRREADAEFDKEEI
jgi:hypothetical protein